MASENQEKSKVAFKQVVVWTVIGLLALSLAFPAIAIISEVLAR